MTNIVTPLDNFSRIHTDGQSAAPRDGSYTPKAIDDLFIINKKESYSSVLSSFSDSSLETMRWK